VRSRRDYNKETAFLQPLYRNRVRANDVSRQQAGLLAQHSERSE